MADADWGHIAVSAGSSLLSGLGGLLFGIWRWGRRSAQHDQRVRSDYDTKISGLREETRNSMASYEKSATARNDSLVDQFKESFEGIRRQLDEHRLDTEKRFLPKDDFRDFRDEYREDMRDLKRNVAEILGTKP